MKNQKGITLIALVITIIVLLILAGVSIAMLTGQNGLLTKASGAKTSTNEAEAREVVTTAVGTILANKYDPTYKGEIGTNGAVDTSKLYNTIDAATVMAVIQKDTGLTDQDVHAPTKAPSVTDADGHIQYKEYVVSFDENGKILAVTEASTIE